MRIDFNDEFEYIEKRKSVALIESDLAVSFLAEYVANGCLVCEKDEVELDKLPSSFSDLFIASETFFPDPEVLSDWLIDETRTITYITSVNLLETFYTLSGLSDKWTINRLERKNELSVIGIRLGIESDHSCEDIRRGIELARTDFNSTCGTSGKTVSSSPIALDTEYLERYLGVLQFLNSMPPSVDKSIKDIQNANQDTTSNELSVIESCPVGTLDSNTARMAAEIVRLQSRLQTVERRYDSLASSKLGKLTLKYWSWKRKNR